MARCNEWNKAAIRRIWRVMTVNVQSENVHSGDATNQQLLKRAVMEREAQDEPMLA
ncbi:MAG: hypothetical protein HY562_06855 [Ignavibacteriales bacterium]|nr:hypothetical protein [Ignavibacteriales bacterium]